MAYIDLDEAGWVAKGELRITENELYAASQCYFVAYLKSGNNEYRIKSKELLEQYYRSTGVVEGY